MLKIQYKYVYVRVVPSADVQQVHAYTVTAKKFVLMQLGDFVFFTVVKPSSPFQHLPAAYFKVTPSVGVHRPVQLFIFFFMFIFLRSIKSVERWNNDFRADLMTSS